MNKAELFGRAMKTWLVGFCLLLVSGCAKKVDPIATPSYPESDFLSREINISGKTQRYRVFVPKTRTPGERLPIMLYLHGSDERGDNNEGQLSGPAPLILANSNNFRFIIVFPQCPIGRIWDKEMVEIAMAELAQTVSEFNADESQTYLAGFSLGGFGTWMAAATYPDKFAAIMPMSGRVFPRSGERSSVSQEIRSLADADQPYNAVAERLSKMPVWIFHGANDPIVPVENSRQMAKALKAVGNENARYTELENTGHVSLNAAFSDPELLKWLSAQHISAK